MSFYKPFYHQWEVVKSIVHPFSNEENIFLSKKRKKDAEQCVVSKNEKV